MTTSADQNARPTWAKVAEHLGCSREALDNLRKLPGAPTEKDAAKWAEWVTANGHLKGGSRRLTEIKILIAEEELKKRRRENAVAEGELIPREIAGEAASRAMGQLARILTQKLEVEAPARLQGKDIVGIRRELRTVHDEIADQWNSELELWQPTQRN
jgi:hypothetical protein